MNRSVDLSQFRPHSPPPLGLTRAPGESADVVDFCSPGNPYFPTPDMFAQLSSSLERILKSYPSDATTIAGELAGVLGLPPQTIAMANGATELITWLDNLMVRESVAVPVPTFGRWTDQSLETGKRVDMFKLSEQNGFLLDVDQYVQFIRTRGSRVAVLCNPGNPDGGYLPQREVIRLMDSLADLDLVIIDESFIDFVDAEAVTSVAAEATLRPNVIVLSSLGKSFGLPGVRFGYAVGNPSVIEVIRRFLPRWNLNSVAEAVVHMVRDNFESYVAGLRLLARDRQEMAVELQRIPGMVVHPSQANFILVKLPPGVDGALLRDYLLTRHRVLIRECSDKLGITSQFVRLGVRPRGDVERLFDGFCTYLGLTSEPVLREPVLREPAVREPAVREPALREPAPRELTAEPWTPAPESPPTRGQQILRDEPALREQPLRLAESPWPEPEPQPAFDAWPSSDPEPVPDARSAPAPRPRYVPRPIPMRE